MRRIPLSYRSHITGFQPVDGQRVEHESALERDFVTLCRFLSPEARIQSQPITLPFDGDGERRRYTPDFRVDFPNGLFELVEIKYRQDLREGWAKFRPGFVAARNWARHHGGGFRIATERGIRTAQLENAKRLLPLRQAPLDMALAETVLKAVRRQPICAFSEVVAALPFDRPIALATVWRMLAHGRLGVDTELPIVGTSRIWASS